MTPNPISPTVRRVAVVFLLVANVIAAALVVERVRAASGSFYCTRDCGCEFEGTPGGWCSSLGWGSSCKYDSECDDRP